MVCIDGGSTGTTSIRRPVLFKDDECLLRRRIDFNVNNSVNGPIGSALIRAYESKHGFMDKSGAMIVRSAD